MITEHFSAAVKYRRQDGTIGSVVVGGSTADRAAEAAERDSAYYLGLGYEIVEVDLIAYCALCCGSGKIQGRRNKLRRVTCPDCRGKNSERTLKSGV